MRILYIYLSFLLEVTNIWGQTKRAIPTSITPTTVPFCGYINPTDCQNDQECQWNPTPICQGKINCSSLTIDKCENTKFCKYNPPSLGYCQSSNFNCNLSNQKGCQNNQLCNWISAYQCGPNDPEPPIPDCSTLNIVQCVKNSEYCDIIGVCFDNQYFCSAYQNKQQCINDPACKYMSVQAEECINNLDYCTKLSQNDCLNNKHCYGFITPGKCVDYFDCDLNMNQCKQNSQYCNIVSKPFKCTSKKNNCSTYTNSKSCLAAGCSQFLNKYGVFKCFYPYTCEQYDQIQCKANDKFCLYTPPTYSCKKKVNCNLITSPIECINNKSCRYKLPLFQCNLKDENYDCAALSVDDCKNNPLCIYKPHIGYCTKDHAYGCEYLSEQNCLLNHLCKIKYVCTQKTLPSCNKLSFDQCKKSSYCHQTDISKCSKNIINCNLPQEDCIRARSCEWKLGTNYSCTNIFDCNGFSEVDCKKNDAQCNFVVGRCIEKTK